MYCSIDEAWNNKNSIANISKRYQEHFNVNSDNELDNLSLMILNIPIINKYLFLDKMQDIIKHHQRFMIIIS